MRLLNETKTLKKKTENILIHLRENQDIEDKKLQLLIIEVKNHLKYFSDNFISAIENFKKEKKSQIQEIEESNFQENSSFLESNEKNRELNNEEQNLKQKTLKIYQFESENANEEEFFNYNCVKKAKKKEETSLMKELSNFFDKNQRNIDSEVIDFSNKTQNKKPKELFSFMQSSKIKINLNEIKNKNMSTALLFTRE